MLFLQHGEELYYYATRLLGAPAEARDIVHDVFERLWQRRKQWEVGGGSARAYLYRAVRSRALDALDRRRVRKRHADERQRENRTQRFAQAQQPGEAVRPDAHLEKQELQDALRHAVDALPSRQREAFRLTNRQDLSYKEAAQVMGIAKNTVAVHVHEALRSLRDAIDELHSDSSRKPS